EPRTFEVGEMVFSKSLHTAEAGLATLIRGLCARAPKPIAIDVERAVSWFEQKRGISLAPAQKQGIASAVTAELPVITGGPGTGKTTLINGIIQILMRKGRRIVLCAPTGRAAKRMAETTGHEASTVHRLLEYSPKAATFQRGPENPLESDMVILDEASMVDTMLADHLFRAVPA